MRKKKPRPLDLAVDAVRAGAKLAAAAFNFDVSAVELRAALKDAGISFKASGTGSRERIMPGTTLRRETTDVGTPQRALKLSLAYLSAPEIDVAYLEDRIVIQRRAPRRGR